MNLKSDTLDFWKCVKCYKMIMGVNGEHFTRYSFVGVRNLKLSHLIVFTSLLQGRLLDIYIPVTIVVQV